MFESVKGVWRNVLEMYEIRMEDRKRSEHVVRVH